MAESILTANGLLTTDEQLMETDETSIEINITEQDEKILLETAEEYDNAAVRIAIQVSRLAGEPGLCFDYSSYFQFADCRNVSG